MGFNTTIFIVNDAIHEVHNGNDGHHELHDQVRILNGVLYEHDLRIRHK